jgi:pimeloyl-ACP methyl ester carboxylesterase
MKYGTAVIGLTLVLMLSMVGCGSPPPSLTANELQQKYPDAKYVQIDGVALHIKQQGLGRPLVLLHGLPTNTYLWRNIIPGLTFGNTIYSLDLMGFGLSEKPQNPSYSIETYVAQLTKFLEEYHLQNPILVGHDISAPIVTLYTLRNPDKVRKLILMSAPLYPEAPSFSVRLLRTKLIGEMFTGDWFLKRIFRNGVQDQAAMPDALIEEYLKPYHDDPGARTALLKCVREFDLRPTLEKEITPNLGKIQTPTLIMWGDGDPYVPLAFAKKLKDDIPNSTLQVVLRTGHFAIEERPEEVRALLKEFIDK